MRSKSPKWVIAALLLWLVLIGIGFTAILNYQTTSGATGKAADYWPAHSGITREPNRFTLVLFAHPRCACTRATIEELNRILARGNGTIGAQVWFFEPDGESPSWKKTSLQKSAADIPGVAVHSDIGGKEARLFGAETSGCAFLYDSMGKLVFSGGITGSRGHAGDNSGEQAIISLACGKSPESVQTPVYGCSLMGDCAPTTTVNK